MRFSTRLAFLYLYPLVAIFFISTIGFKGDYPPISKHLKKLPIPYNDLPYCEEEEVFNEEISRSDNFEEDSILAIQLYNKAEIDYHFGQYDSAIDLIRRSAEVYKNLIPQTSDSTIHANYIDCFFTLGFGYMISNNYPESKKYLLKALKMTLDRFGEEHLIVTKCYNKLANIYEAKGDFETEGKLRRRSLEIRKKILTEDDIMLGHGYTNMAYLFKRKGDYNRASDYYQKVLEIDKKILEKDTADYFELQSQEKLLSTPNKSKQLKALILRDIHYFLASIYLSNADVAERTGEHSNSVQFLQKAYLLMEDNFYKGKPVYISVLIRLARNFLVLGEMEKSFESLEKAKDMAKQLFKQKSWAYALLYFGYGDWYLKNSDFKNALGFYQKALQLRLKLAGPGYYDNEKILNYLAIGRTYLKMEKYSVALGYLQKNLLLGVPGFRNSDVFSNPNAASLKANYQLLISTLSLKGEAFKRRYFEKNGDLKDLEMAFDTYRLVIQLRKKVLEKELQSERAKVSWIDESYHLYEIALETILELQKLKKDPSYLEAVFSTVETFKSLLLLEAVQGSKATKYVEVPSELLEKEHYLKIEVNYYEKTIFEEEQKKNLADSFKLAKWGNRLFDLRQSLDSLTDRLKVRNPVYFNLKHNTKTASLREVQDFLPDEKTALVEYFFGEVSLYTLVVTKKEVRVSSAKIDSALLNQIQTFRTLLFDYQPGVKSEEYRKEIFRQFVETSSGIYQKLLEPALSGKELNNLIIIPDGPLNYLPFQALLTAQPDSVSLSNYNYRNLPYLFLDYTLRNEFSSSLLIESKKRKTGSGNYVGFAPEYEKTGLASNTESDQKLMAELYPKTTRAGLSPLLFNKEEVESVATGIGGEYFLGTQATELQFRRIAPKAGILHLAVHTLTNDERPLLSQLVFSRLDQATNGIAPNDQDGFLYAYDLYNMKLKADLAVLSGCNTGDGKLLRGEGIMSLSRAFKYAGCPNIVMSLWEANDYSSKEIIAGFFDNLKLGKRKNVALQEARKQFLFSTSDELTHPYYWATFVLIGDDAPVDFGHSAWWYWLASGLVVVGVLGGFWLMRRKGIRNLS